jgi:hypothetical protein
LTIPGARALVSASLSAALLITGVPPTPAAAADPSEASQVFAIA